MTEEKDYKIVKGNEGREPISSFRQTANCFSAYEINPALGCDFGCTYCSMYAQEEDMAHQPVKIFSDYPEYLRDAISHLKAEGIRPTFNFTPKSDVLMPSLIDSGVTQKILDILTETESRFYMITKGGVPPEDVQERIYKAKDLGQIILSAGLPDEKYRMRLEPNAPSIEQRMELGRFCTENGIRAAGIVAPFLPGMGEDYKEGITKRYRSAGVDHLSIHIMKVSEHCLERMAGILGDRIKEAYTESESIDWGLPGGRRVKRFYANPEIMKNELYDFKSLAEDKGMTVSVCKDVMRLIGDNHFNSGASRRGITCVGFRR
ncbi:MAG: radical SAM protein [Candidatus Woesearchaeota archaeon]